MGGNTEWGGPEAVAVVSRKRGVEKRGNFEYKLMATSETSTMQKEMQQAADQGFGYRGQNVFDTAFGGNEVVVIMERDRDAKPERYEYKMLATSKTSTLQKELIEAGEAGFHFVGMTVAQTAFGGKELVTILCRNSNKEATFQSGTRSQAGSTFSKPASSSVRFRHLAVQPIAVDMLCPVISTGL